jgi:uncharacterized protein YbjQ (UPF0145 family)
MKASLGVLASIIVLAATPAVAADALGPHDLAGVLQRPDYMSQLEGVQFYFGDAPHPAVARTIEADTKTSLRTRKFGRSAEEACQWVLLSSLLSLKERALATGGNAVVNIRSNWENVETSSSSQYQCAVGGLMAGVALKGDIVSIR